MAFGLTPTGFVPKDLETIRSEIVEEIADLFGESVGEAAASDTAAIGQLVGIIAERFALLWQLAEAINSSADPDKATGTELEALAALTGTVREPATLSEIVLALTGTAATLVPGGSQASEEDTGVTFETLADATIVAAPVWAPTTAYVVGDRVENDTPDRIYECVVAGTSAGAGGPTGTGTGIVDGGVTWDFLGEGDGVVDAAAEATETGPKIALARKVTVIETPVSGWSGVINVLDADPGSDIESDADFRIRREDELATAGTSPIDAVRAALLDILDVEFVSLFVNNTDDPITVGGVDIPPHAVEALIIGGDDQDIWDALLANIAAGIQTFGTEIGSATDSEGNVHTQAFSRPDEVEIYIDIELTYDAALYPTDGDDQVKAAIVAQGNLSTTGKDSVSSAVKSWCFDVPGVLDVTLAEIDDAPAPSSEATVAINVREIAKYDTSRITVVSVSGTP